MNRDKTIDLDYFLEVDRMVNEGLGGGMFEQDYHQQQIEIPIKMDLENKSTEQNSN